MLRRVLVVLVAAVLGGCTSGGASLAPAERPSPARSTDAPQAAVPIVLEPLALGADVVAVPRERFTPMWSEPSTDAHPSFRMDTRNPLGRLAPMLVRRAATLGEATWYEVLLPLRPNGTSAWVRAEDVVARERSERIVVDLSRRLLWRYAGDRLVARLDVGVGTAATPTGTGRFYVWVKVTYDDPSGPYGMAALGLSGFSPVLSEWPGEGRMAVHGTADPSDRGRAVSHGCVRVYNEDLATLLDLPLGTPVIIRA